jgi:hypothetical protein
MVPPDGGRPADGAAALHPRIAVPAPRAPAPSSGWRRQVAEYGAYVDAFDRLAGIEERYQVAAE